MRDSVNIVSVVLDTLTLFKADPRVGHVVFIFVNHGNEKGLFFPGGGFYPAGELANYCGRYWKPILLVLDCCSSTAVAEEVVKTLAPKVPVGLLCSGPVASYTSAVVIGSDPDLVNRSDGPNLPAYAIFSSMFSRSLMQAVIYAGANPPLADLPARLHSPQPDRDGFEAAFLSNSQDMREKCLRDFFPAAVSPATVVLGAERPFAELIPERPRGGFPDDIGRPWAGSRGPRDFGFLCTTVRRRRLFRRGTLEWSEFRRLDTDPGTPEGKIRGTIRMDRDALLQKRPVHVPVMDIVDYVKERLQREGNELVWNGDVFHSDLPRDLVHFVLEENGMTPRELFDVNDLAFYLAPFPLPYIQQVIREGIPIILARQNEIRRAAEAAPHDEVSSEAGP